MPRISERSNYTAVPISTDPTEGLKQTTSQASLKEPSRVQRVCDIVKQLAINVLKLAATVAVYWVNSSLFALGFVTGVVVDGLKCSQYCTCNRVKGTINKIKQVWSTQRWGSSVLLGLGAFLSLPVIMAVTSFGVGAHVGSKMVRDASKFANGQHPKNTPYWYLWPTKI